MKIALVHYAYPPVVGGVEFVMEQHAALFARSGHEVVVVTGDGEATGSYDLDIVVIPEMLPSGELCELAQKEVMDGGKGEGAFLELKDELVTKIGRAIAGCDIVFVHNMLTMHFNLAATAALWELASQENKTRFVNWVHDLSAIDSHYSLVIPKGDSRSEAPLGLISRPHPRIFPVAISPRRQRQYAKLMGVEEASCPVVPNGVEVMSLLKLPLNVRQFARGLGIVHRDIVLIHPTRILRRKNIELGIRVLAEIRKRRQSVLYLVTGAPDPHNEEAAEYGDELRQLVKELDVEDSFAFVGDSFPVSDRGLLGLYSLSDALFLPSKQEGFGLPLLEAGFFRMPAFCPRIEPMQSILTNNVNLFELDDDPGAIAELVISTLESDTGHLSRKETIFKYSWERILRKHMEPLFFNEENILSAQNQTTLTPTK